MTSQRQQRFSPTGVTNHLVWDRLEQRDYPLLAYRRLMLEEGVRGPPVVVVQRVLGVRADGAFGPMTAAAVKAFRQASS